MADDKMNPFILDPISRTNIEGRTALLCPGTTTTFVVSSCLLKRFAKTYLGKCSLCHANENYKGRNSCSHRIFPGDTVVPVGMLMSIPLSQCNLFPPCF